MRKAISLFSSYLIVSLSVISAYFIGISLGYGVENQYSLQFEYSDPDPYTCDKIGSKCVFNEPLRLTFLASDLSSSTAHPVYPDDMDTIEGDGLHFSTYRIGDGLDNPNIVCHNKYYPDLPTSDEFVCTINEFPALDLSSGNSLQMSVSFYVDNERNLYTTTNGFILNVNPVDIFQGTNIVASNDLPNQLDCYYPNNDRCVFDTPSLELRIGVSGLNSKMDLGEIVGTPTVQSEIVSSVNCNQNPDNYVYTCTLYLNDLDASRGSFTDHISISFNSRIYYKTDHRYYTDIHLETSKDVAIIYPSQQSNPLDSSTQSNPTQTENTDTQSSQSTATLDTSSQQSAPNPSMSVSVLNNNLHCIVNQEEGICEFTDDLKLRLDFSGLDSGYGVSVSSISYSFLGSSESLESACVEDGNGLSYLCNIDLGYVDDTDAGQKSDTLELNVQANVVSQDSVYGPYTFDVSDDIEYNVLSSSNVLVFNPEIRIIDISKSPVCHVDYDTRKCNYDQLRFSVRIENVDDNYEASLNSLEYRIGKGLSRYADCNYLADRVYTCTADLSFVSSDVSDEGSLNIDFYAQIGISDESNDYGSYSYMLPTSVDTTIDYGNRVLNVNPELNAVLGYIPECVINQDLETCEFDKEFRMVVDVLGVPQNMDVNVVSWKYEINGNEGSMQCTETDERHYQCSFYHPSLSVEDSSDYKSIVVRADVEVSDGINYDTVFGNVETSVPFEVVLKDNSRMVFFSPAVNVNVVQNPSCVIDINTHQCSFDNALVFDLDVTGVEENLDVDVSNVEYSFLGQKGSMNCVEKNDRLYECTANLQPITTDSAGTDTGVLSVEMDMQVSNILNVYGPYHVSTGNVNVEYEKKANIVTLGSLDVDIVEVGNNDVINCDMWARDRNDIRCYFSNGKIPVLLRINGLDSVDNNGALVSDLYYEFDGKEYDEYGRMEVDPNDNSVLRFYISPEPLTKVNELVQSGDLVKRLEVKGTLTYSILGELRTQSFDVSKMVKVDRIAYSGTDIQVMEDAAIDLGSGVPNVDDSMADMIQDTASKLKDYDDKIKKYEKIAMYAYSVGAALMAAFAACCASHSCGGCHKFAYFGACAFSLGSLVAGYYTKKIKEQREKREDLYKNLKSQGYQVKKGEETPFEKGWYQAVSSILVTVTSVMCLGGLMNGFKDLSAKGFFGGIKGMFSQGLGVLKSSGWAGFLGAGFVAGAGAYAATGEAGKAAEVGGTAAVMQWLYSSSNAKVKKDSATESGSKSGGSEDFTRLDYGGEGSKEDNYIIKNIKTPEGAGEPLPQNIVSFKDSKWRFTSDYKKLIYKTDTGYLEYVLSEATTPENDKIYFKSNSGKKYIYDFSTHSWQLVS